MRKATWIVESSRGKASTPTSCGLKLRPTGPLIFVSPDRRERHRFDGRGRRCAHARIRRARRRRAHLPATLLMLQGNLRSRRPRRRWRRRGRQARARCSTPRRSNQASRRWLPLVDLLVVNEGEAARLGGAGEPEAARRGACVALAPAPSRSRSARAARCSSTRHIDAYAGAAGAASSTPRAPATLSPGCSWERSTIAGSRRRPRSLRPQPRRR